jgi:hypothetical protein
MNWLNYVSLYESESFGSFGSFGIKILVAASEMPDLNELSIRDAVYDVAEILLDKIKEASIALNEEEQNRAKKEKEQLIKLFPGLIYVEKIPNEYCSRYCCRHRPWFIITTVVGRFKIGWRKRVIQIDWSDTVGTKSVEELFALEDVTKGSKYIHAWSLKDAGRYISDIMTTAENPK